MSKYWGATLWHSWIQMNHFLFAKLSWDLSWWHISGMMLTLPTILTCLSFFEIQFFLAFPGPAYIRPSPPHYLSEKEPHPSSELPNALVANTPLELFLLFCLGVDSFVYFSLLPPLPAAILWRQRLCLVTFGTLGATTSTLPCAWFCQGTFQNQGFSTWQRQWTRILPSKIK